MTTSNFFSKISRHKPELYIFAAIFIIGIFLRVYNFSDWLHFEIDQTYDFNIVSRAIENGPGNLPLLGPTAGGGRALRLGPAFYYMEYVSAMIFGNTPTGHAMLVLLFSIASIPLFYFFIRRFFDKRISLAICLVYAVSFYNVLYSRFSWSPNVLPFLIILSFFALLKSVDEHEEKKDKWFLLAVFSLSIVTQIHFNAFFTIPPIVILFLLIKRPRFTFKTWLFAILIVFTVYSPMIASDISTKGENLQFFKKKMFKANGAAFKVKSSFIEDLQQNMRGYFFIVTGHGEINSKRMNGLDLVDTRQPAKNFLIGLSAAIFFIAGLFLMLIKVFRGKNQAKKDFVILNALWLSMSFLYFFSIVNSYRMYPRFFLLISPLAIIFLGLIIEKILSLKILQNKIFRISLLTFIALLLATSNIIKINEHFDLLNVGQKQEIPTLETEDIFPNTARITLSQQEEISNYIQSKFKKNGFPVYIDTKNEYKPAFWYQLEKRGISYYDEVHDSPLYKEANYFFILQSDKPVRIGEKYFVYQEKKKFGSLTVYYHSANESAITDIRQDEKTKKETDETKHILELPTWNKIF